MRFAAAATIVVMSLIVFAGRVQAIVIESTFDSGLDGWTGTGGTVSWVSTGGNPGGFVRVDDAVDPGTMILLAPTKFLGDLSAFANGTLYLDGIRLSDAFVDANFGVVFIRNGPDVLFFDPAQGGTTYPLASWSTFSQRIHDSASALGILSNVTSIEVQVEYAALPSPGVVLESVGFDSFRIDSVPEPAGLLVLGAMLNALPCARCSRRSPRCAERRFGAQRQSR